MRGPLGARDTRDARDSAPDDDAPESIPSSQRTTFDVAALASLAGLHDTGGNVPLGMCVPVRTPRELPAALGRAEIRFLFYLDGATSLGAIAEEMGIPLPEAIAIFLGLLSQAVIEVPGEAPPPSDVVPRSSRR